MKIARRHYTQLKDSKLIIQARFYGNSKRSHCIVITRYRMFMLIITDLALSFDIVETELLTQRLFDIHCIHLFEDFNQEGTVNGRYILAVADAYQLNIISLCDYEVNYRGFILRPANVEKGWLPIITSITVHEKSHHSLLLIWKNTISLVRVDQEQIIVTAFKEYEYNIIWAGFLENKVLGIVNSNNELIFETVYSIFLSSSNMLVDMKLFYGKMMLIGNIQPSKYVSGVVYPIAPLVDPNQVENVAVNSESKHTEPVQPIQVFSTLEKMFAMKDFLIYVSEKRIVAIQLKRPTALVID